MPVTSNIRIEWPKIARAAFDDPAKLPHSGWPRRHPGLAHFQRMSRQRRSYAAQIEFGVEHHSHLAAEKIEQYGNPLALGHFLIEAEAGREDAVQYADLVAGSERRRQAELNESGFVLPLLQPFNHTDRNRRGLVADADQPADAERRMNASPLLHRPCRRRQTYSAGKAAPRPSRPGAHGGAASDSAAGTRHIPGEKDWRTPSVRRADESAPRTSAVAQPGSWCALLPHR